MTSHHLLQCPPSMIMGSCDNPSSRFMKFCESKIRFGYKRWNIKVPSQHLIHKITEDNITWLYDGANNKQLNNRCIAGIKIYKDASR